MELKSWEMGEQKWEKKKIKRENKIQKWKEKKKKAWVDDEREREKRERGG